MLKLIAMPNTDKDSDSRGQDHTGQALIRYWPIIVAGAVTLLSLGGIFVKLDYIAKAIDRNDQQFSVMNERQNLTSQSMIELRGQVTRQGEDIARTNAATADVRARVDVLADKLRWAPNGK